MKQTFQVLAAALTATLAISGCVKGREDTEELRSLVIEATIPSDAMKAGFSGENALHVFWKSGDALRVINHQNPERNAEFAIQPGFTDHRARFAGTVPVGAAGARYDIITPASYGSVWEADEGDYELTQSGNGNPDHLVFTAMLSNVAQEDLADVTFSNAWVSEHPGTSLSKGAVIKVTTTLPAEVTEPTRVAVSGIGYREVSAKLTGVSSDSNKNLVVYLQYGWDQLEIAGQTTLVLHVQDADGRGWKTTKQTTNSVQYLQAGSVNGITFPGTTWTEELFAGGDGTEANPYLIATPAQLDNMRLVLVSLQKIHFRLVKDLDMASYLSSHPWVPLNSNGTGYNNAVDLDGGGHTIDHFSCTRTSASTSNHCALFGVLYGEVHDLKFTNAFIDQQTTNNYGAGIVASYCGYTQSQGQPAHVYNVDVHGTVKNAGHFTGGIAGMADDALIESCSADVHVWSNGKNCVGGILGVDENNSAAGSRTVRPSTIRNCWTSGTVRGNQKIGGIVGCLGGQSATQYTTGSSVYNCYSVARVDYNQYNGDVSVASGGSRHVGGIVGMATQGATGVSIPTTLKPDNHIEGCIAWQERISENGNGDIYPAAAIVGYTSTFNYLANCWRNPSMVYDFNEKSFIDQEDADPDHPLQGVEPSYYYPYHGKAASSSNLSSVARSIGWSEEVWDFSGSTPQFREPRRVESTSATSGSASVPSAYAKSGARDAGAKYPQPGDPNWIIEQIRPGITYYHYENTADADYTANSENARYYNDDTNQTVNYHTTGATHQNVFVVDVDLNRKDYEVKIVRTSGEVPTSSVYADLGAYVAINGAYERGSIAERDNAYYYNTGANAGRKDLYPNGYRAAWLQNDEIGDSGISNWKNHGTFYCDGQRGVSIAFDAYDPAKGQGDTGVPPVKSIQDQRSFYNYYTGDKSGFISSSPVLIADYWQVGGLFHTKWYTESKSYIYNGHFNAEHPFVHQRSLFPRTAVAINSENHLLLFVCDGKYPDSVGGVGMSSGWVTDFLYRYFNPQWAINLDGGGSATMCVDASDADPDTFVVNYPNDNYTGKREGLKGGGKSNNYDHDGERPRNCFIVVAPRENFGTMPTP